MGGIAVGIEEADRQRLDVLRRRSVGRAIASSSSASGATMLPSAAIRSSTSKRRWRGTSGSGLSQVRSNMPGVRSRPISSTSRKPLVVSSPTRPPRFCSRVLEPTVVPCSTSVMSPGAMPASSRSAATPARTACSGWSGVDETFFAKRRPSSATRTRSVNVPPISTPMRALDPILLASLEEHSLLSAIFHSVNWRHFGGALQSIINC